ncbi:helix-turn-helix domain-containing protein [Blastopirellula marina]|uniref:HTH cro/C1-type domain-containing protein n=1 Tax=Blastopirellula marina TaxID=124 RepID=A0A2S8GN12_9BACT|nr:helix-turn-helix transcriptional regulator [Blastopirellula marina]PQO45808.1 hypothetical protein C5Y93_12860 [Blastopirellula marina]
MATVPFELTRGSLAFVSPRIRPQPATPLHRIREVRKEQGVSLRTAARRLGITSSQVRDEEEETSDLLLTQLYRWSQALDVPVQDLLEEPECDLSAPIRQRAKLVRVMKTAKAILERSKESSIRIMAETLVDQLNDIMPELNDVNAWNNVGQRRSLDDLGRTAQRSFSEDSVIRAMRD